MEGSETLLMPPSIPQSGAGLPFKRIGTSYVYWMLAHSYFLPGLYMQRYATQMGLSLMAGGRRDLPRHLHDRLLDGTLNSTRYLEFDFVWKSFPAAASGLFYLDVFSPWQLPILLVHRKRLGLATIVHPSGAAADSVDALVRGAGLAYACRVLPSISVSSLGAGSFDVITSIGGLAAQADDRGALAQMWRLLKPGGSLMLTLPCQRTTRRTTPETADASRGRVYDSRMLADRIFAVIDEEPVASVVYGDTRPADPGAHPSRSADDNAIPSPREPLTVGRNWQCFPRIEDLPGAGVIALRFAKPDEPAADVTLVGAAG